MIDRTELPRIGWITLADAADRLGMTPWHVRGWVRAGRLHAELRRGPYGPHYYVPIQQVEGLAAELAASRPVPSVALGAVDPTSMDDEALLEALRQLRAEVQLAVESREATEAALREELNQIRTELAAGIEALKMARVSVVEPAARAPWWRLW